VEEPRHGEDRPPRRSWRFVIWPAVAVVVLLLAVEVAGLPLAARAVSAELRTCVEHESLRVDQVARPVVGGLASGRLRDVQVTVTGAMLGGLRIEAAELATSRITLPWGRGPTLPDGGEIVFRVTEEDLADRLAELMPFGIRPVLDLRPGRAAIGVPAVDAMLEVTALVEASDLVLRLVGPVPRWWQHLGLDDELRLPTGTRIRELTVTDGALLAAVRFEDVTYERQAC
jgi:hypothetical protein